MRGPAPDRLAGLQAGRDDRSHRHPRRLRRSWRFHLAISMESSAMKGISAIQLKLSLAALSATGFQPRGHLDRSSGARGPGRAAATAGNGPRAAGNFVEPETRPQQPWPGCGASMQITWPGRSAQLPPGLAVGAGSASVPARRRPSERRRGRWARSPIPQQSTQPAAR